MSTPYETDFHAWASEQAILLRTGRFTEIDLANIVEEIDSLARGVRSELRRALQVLLQRLIAWVSQPGFHSSSVRGRVTVARMETADLLEESPSLVSWLPEAVDKAYRSARILALADIGLAEDAFPLACPWSPTQILLANFWPEPR